MSAYEPPTADYPIFDSLAFQTPNSASLTLAEGDIRYLARQNIATSVASLTSFTGGIDTPLINTASTINFTSAILDSNIDIGNNNLTNLFPTKNNIAIGNGVMNGAGLLVGAINNTGIGGSVLTGLTNGDRNVAIGHNIATGITTGSDNIILGSAAAGSTLTTGTNNVILGNSANVSAAGAGNSIAIGNGAVATTSTIAIGNAAGGGQAFGAIAIGDSAGKGSQLGNAISIGYLAGNAGQAVNSIAIGNFAGGGSVQSGGAIAIGVNAGRVAQGDNAVAIGNGAGHGTSSAQGDNAIAIGNGAGNGSQVAGSICLSAGTVVNPGNAGFFVAPVRSIGGISTTADLQPIYYNTTSRELVSGTPTTVKTVGTAVAAAMTTNVAQSLITGGLSITPGTYIVELFCVATTTAVAGNLILYNISLSSNVAAPGLPILQPTSNTASVPAVAGQIVGNFTTILTVAATTQYYLWHLAQFTGIVPTSSPSGSYVRTTRIA